MYKSMYKVSHISVIYCRDCPIVCAVQLSCTYTFALDYTILSLYHVIIMYVEFNGVYDDDDEMDG